MAIDFSYIDHDILGDVADAIRFVEGSTASIAPSDYPNRIRALDKYISDYSVLNFTMPNGGTISLNKIGSPTVVELEYSLDCGTTWTVWPEDGSGNRSLTLTAGQRMYVRNTSETSTMFSTGSNNRYVFAFTTDTYANGNTNSLLCKNPDNAVLTQYCFLSLFNGSLLKTAPSLPSTTLANNCYFNLFRNCDILEKAPLLPATILPNRSYYFMFYSCNNLKYVRTAMLDISATDSISYWLSGVADTGDFYCPSELTIPTGVSGIPSGWTRHDLT